MRVSNVGQASSPGESLIIYLARSVENHTELRACSVGVEDGIAHLYVTGGTTGQLFSKTKSSEQESQLVIAKMKIAGGDVTGAQVGFSTKHIYGSNVVFNRYSEPAELLVASHVQDSSSSTSALYRFNPISLGLEEQPSLVNSFGTITPRGIAASPKFVPATNTSVVFIAGTARISEDKKNDVMCDFHSRYGNKSEDLPLYSEYIARPLRAINL